MTNPFAQHGIEHLSASSLNKYRKNPSQWVVNYLFKVRDEATDKMQRGLDVEMYLHKLLITGEIPNDYAELVLRMHEAIKKKGTLISYQKPIAPLVLSGTEVPITGFLDFEYEDCIVDTKVSSRVPSGLSNDYKLQGTIYAMAENKQIEFLFGVPLKKGVQVLPFPLEKNDYKIDHVYSIVRSIRSLLSFSEDRYAIANLFSPDLSAWGWGEETTQAAKEIWGVS